MPNIEHTVCTSRSTPIFDSEAAGCSATTLFATIVSRLINRLTVESRALGTSIALLSDLRVEIDSLIRYLKTVLPTSGNLGPSTS